MNKQFLLLGTEILTSSVWSEPLHVKVVWITMLLMCDLDGYVGASSLGISRMAGVSHEETRDAIDRLESPDPASRSKENEGRRIVPVERGWKILNFGAYLDRMASARRKNRERVRAYRARQKAKNDPQPCNDYQMGSKQIVPHK